MQHFPYIGSGPYCYANAFAMMFGQHAPSTAVIEFATGSPFGMLLVGGCLPFFDPFGWTPEAGFDAALDAMGWTSSVTSGGNAADAVERLRSELVHSPVWVGPVEMGWLRHQPGKDGPIGADHYVVVIGLANDWVQLHDPQVPIRDIADRRFPDRMAGGNHRLWNALHHAFRFPTDARGRRR